MPSRKRTACQGSAAVNEAALSSVGPGCFVKVQRGQQCFWAEVQSSHDGHITATVRRELADRKCPNPPSTCQATFDRGEISEMGCDQYCWC